MDEKPGGEGPLAPTPKERRPALDPLSGAVLDRDRPFLWRPSSPMALDLVLAQGSAILGELEPTELDGGRWSGECLGVTLELWLERNSMLGVRVTSTGPGDAPGPAFRGMSAGWGKVELPAGGTLRWRPVPLGFDQHRLLDEERREILRLRPPFFHLGVRRTQLVVRPAGWSRTDLAELILLTACLRHFVRPQGHVLSRRPRPTSARR